MINSEELKLFSKILKILNEDNPGLRTIPKHCHI